MEELPDLTGLKKHVHQALLERIKSDIALLNDALREVQLSANNETKSSAGDKYETGRAMAQLEIEKLSGSLSEKERALAFVNALSLEPLAHVAPGALVKTSSGLFYLSVNGGEIITPAGVVRCISTASPLGTAIKGKTTGDTFALMQREHRIDVVA